MADITLRRLDPMIGSEWVAYFSHTVGLARLGGKVTFEDILAIHERYNELTSILSRSKVAFAEVDGEQVGMVEYDLPYGGHAEIQQLYVRKNFRGKGIGRKLVREVLEEARRMDCGRVTLVPRRDQDNPKEDPRLFYTKMGFRGSDITSSSRMNFPL